MLAADGVAVGDVAAGCVFADGVASGGVVSGGVAGSGTAAGGVAALGEADSGAASVDGALGGASGQVEAAVGTRERRGETGWGCRRGHAGSAADARRKRGVWQAAGCWLVIIPVGG